MANRDEIDQIKDKLNIVDVVREYVHELKHAGRNYFARCPFHSEKTPSFSVNEDIQRFKCFGCGVSGDVINFIEKIEGIDFPKAVEMAAKRAGIELKREFNPYKDKLAEEKRKILEANRLVANFYHYILIEHKLGEKGREYARTRKFSKGAIKDFLIGYAPEGYENLKKYMLKKGYKTQDLVKWSLLVEKNGRIYDKFRKRLMFPIFNHVGDVIGFSGRVIDKEDIPKYLNSSETLVYKKSNVLYGLYQNKEEIRTSREAILVEGNIDVPTAYRFGIRKLIAPMGTALTTQQLELIKRYAEKIFFSFDSDSAGEKALIRGFEMAEKLGIESRAIDLGSYTDLDEYLNKNPEAAKKAVEESLPVIEHIIIRKSKEVDFNDAKSKAKFINEIVPLLQYVRDDIEKTHYVQLLAGTVNADEKVIWNKLGNAIVESADKLETDNQITETVLNLSSEEELVAFLLQYPILNNDNIDLRVLADQNLINVYSQVTKFESVKDAIDKSNPEHQQLLSNLYTRPLGDFESEIEMKQYFEKLYKRLLKQSLSNKLNELQKSIQHKESLGEDVSALLKEQLEILRKIR